jgi:Cytochrome C and Quinol oxidase polypeptide I
VVETRLGYAHGLAAIVALLISVAFGVVASIELLVPDIAGHSAWLTWGRLRYDHTQGILLGWLGNAFFAFLYHAVPVLTGRRVTSASLGHWIFGLWNFAVLAPGWVLVLAGFSQPLEWAEFPAGDRSVPAAIFRAWSRRPVCVELVHHRRLNLHAARLSDGKLRARTAPRRARCRVQRAVDPRCDRPVCNASGTGDSVFCDSRVHAPADFQPLSIDARFSGFCFSCTR